jgi:hypothetical protein
MPESSVQSYRLEVVQDAPLTACQMRKNTCARGCEVTQSDMLRSHKWWLFTSSLIAFASLVALAQNNQPGDMSVLYDPKLKTPSPKLETKLVAKIVKDLRTIPIYKDMRTDEKCWSPGEFEPWPSPPVAAVAKGSFTRPKSDQLLYIVETCVGPSVGDNTASTVMIYEKEKLISVYKFVSNGLFTGFREGFSVRDIDQNGLSEVALVQSGGDGCGGWTLLDLVQWKSQKPVSLGSLTVGSVACDVVTDYTVYVNKSPKPTFVGAEFARNLKLTLLELSKPSITITTLR